MRRRRKDCSFDPRAGCAEGRFSLSRMKRPTLFRLWSCAAALAALLLCPLPDALAQGEPLPPGVSRGENFSAGKSPAQLFASDCTGAGCHKGPQGLGKGGGLGLAGFLREHYTNSRESAAALANYLSKIPSGPEPREARTPRQGKPAAAASGGPSWGEALGFPPGEKQKPHGASREHQGGRASRAAARPDEEPTAPPAAHTPAAQRGRQPATAAVASPQPSSPESEAAPAPQPAPTPPAPKQYDIFD